MEMSIASFLESYWWLLPIFLLVLYGFAYSRGSKAAFQNHADVIMLDKRRTDAAALDLQRRERALSAGIDGLAREELKCTQDREKWEKQAAKEEARLKLKADLLSERERRINDQVRERTAQTVLNIASRDYLMQNPTFSSIRNEPDLSRLTASLNRNLVIEAPFNISSRISSASGNTYDVTLYSCTCKDFQLHNRPCKHMYRLASELGALLGCDTSSITSQIAILLENRTQLEHELQLMKKNCSRVNPKSKALDRLVSETTQSYPWLAALYADCVDVIDGSLEQRLRLKRPPAKRAADAVSAMRHEKVLLEKQCKMNEYQLHFYESLFPWLEEFRELSPQDAYCAQAAISGDHGSDNEYEHLRSWLSPDEFQRLSPSEKYQLALDRYQKRKKTSWEVGIEYERYIGYLCEQQDYRVYYTGATLGLEDMGRDLVLTKDNCKIVIQCKRWAQEKQIHEKHIFQLFGSCVLLETKQPQYTAVGVFVTTATLSDTARQCAEHLGIKVYEHIPFSAYPLIKCNISHSGETSGEKIYHLPFDQQYDRVVIDQLHGELFASTIAEAETAGFRRAWKHAKSPGAFAPGPGGSF